MKREAWRQRNDSIRISIVIKQKVSSPFPLWFLLFLVRFTGVRVRVLMFYLCHNTDSEPVWRTYCSPHSPLMGHSIIKRWEARWNGRWVRGQRSPRTVHVQCYAVFLKCDPAPLPSILPLVFHLISSSTTSCCALASPLPSFIYLSFNPVIHPLPLYTVSITSVITTAPRWDSSLHLSSLLLRGTHEEEKEMEMLSWGERCGTAACMLGGGGFSSERLVCQEERLQHPLLTWEVTISKEECLKMIVFTLIHSWLWTHTDSQTLSNHPVHEAPQLPAVCWNQYSHQCMCSSFNVTS